MNLITRKIGLVVITLERYFKIEAAEAYLKYYRNWTTFVGVALPWITGFCTIAIPAVASMRAIPGRCPRMGFWPTEDGQLVSQQDTVYSVISEVQT